MSVRARVRTSLQRGELTGGSDVEEVHGIGPHLAARLAVAMRRQGRVTIDQLWRFTRNMDGPRAERFLLRALQNARGNQCVRPGRAGRASYHTGDVNARAYEALAAVLAFRANAPYAAALPARLPRRSVAAKECACRARCDGQCVRTADGLCVPRNARVGFVGAPPHPDQVVVAPTAADQARVRRQARTKNTPAHRADAYAQRDVQDGHNRQMGYSPRGQRMWRRPSPKVRQPARA